MAVGDIIAGINTAAADYNFQPAAGVVVCITSVFRQGGTDFAGIRLFDGTNRAGGIATDGNPLNCKFFITNSYYIQITSAFGAVKEGFTGIQTA